MRRQQTRPKERHPDAAPTWLSATSACVLRWLARGSSTEEILTLEPQLTREDIRRAAREALTLLQGCMDPPPRASLPRSPRRPAPTPVPAPPRGPTGSGGVTRFLREGQPWTEAEEGRLRSLFRSVVPVERMAREVGRSPRSVRNYLRSLGLRM